jgi:putative ABC transport system substrate-binding protein
MNRRDVVVALAALGAAGLPSGACAQARNKHDERWRVGAVSTGTRSIAKPYESAFLAGMNEYGYAVGRNLTVDWRFAEGNPSRFPALIDELLALKPDVLLGSNAGVAIAMRGRTTRIPIVLCTVSDAVGTGLAQSLARPGGNVTGLSMQLHELGAKHIELMAELLPRMRHLALLTDVSQPKALSEPFERIARGAAAARGFSLLVHRVNNLEEIRLAFRAMETQRADALLLDPSPRFNTLRREIAQGAQAIRLPSIAWAEEYVQDGGLLSYGPSFMEAYRRVAYFVDRVFKGAKPSDLPIEQPTKFSLVLNARAARALGITFPRAILVRAERLIE